MTNNASINVSERIQEIKEVVRAGRGLLSDLSVFNHMFSDLDYVSWCMGECIKGQATERNLQELRDAKLLMESWVTLNKSRVDLVRKKASDYVRDTERGYVPEVKRLFKESEDKNKGQFPVYLNKKMLAEKLGVSAYKVEKYLRNGRIPQPRIIGKRAVWHIAEVDDLDLPKIRASR